MTIDDEKLDELERCAEAAPGGEWKLFDKFYIETDDKRCVVADAKIHDEVRHHIAAADPPTVLALVREVRRLREALEEIAGAIEWDTDPRSIRHLCDMAEEALEDTDE